MISVTRRQALAGGLGAASLALTRAARAEDVRLRMYWWGSQERADRSNAANKLYMQQNPSVTINGEFLGWGDYWTKLATQVVGRNAPDVIQMDYRYLSEYARRNALLAFDSYRPATLKIEDFDHASIDVGRVNGKLYGVNLGNNSTATIFNRSAIEELGLQAPTNTSTWDDVAKLGEAITRKANKPGFFGTIDGGDREPLFEVFLRQRGKALYKEDGSLAYGVDDARDWFQLWSDWRKAGICVPADVQSMDKDTIDTSPLSLGKCAIDFAHSNMLVGYQAISKGKLGLSMDPWGGKGSQPGQYLKPSMLLSVSNQSRHPEEAVKLVNWWVTNPDGGKIIGVERGVPASKSLRAAIAPTLDDLGRQMVDYVSYVTDHAGDIPPAPPKGAGELAFALKRMNERVGFGMTSPTDGAKQFIDNANEVLGRS
jgi:multiple sugar transport system substrate-binding protein